MTGRRSLGAVLVAVIPLAAACGSGLHDATQSEHATPYISQVRSDSLLVTNVALVPSGSTTTIGGSTGPASSSSSGGTVEGYLVLTIANTGVKPDQLTGISLADGQVTPTASGASGASNSLQIGPRSVISFGDPELGSSGASLRVTNVSQPVNVGGAIRATFMFANAPPASLDVLVKSPGNLGTTASAYPVNVTGSYPTPSETPSGP